MSTALARTWTQEAFLAWVEAQEAAYEFDGTQPVAMNGGNNNHNLICVNILAALRQKLRTAPCRPMGPGAGVQTVRTAVRYPDCLVTCSPLIGTAHLVPNPVVVFEVISPNSGRLDRVFKVREYAGVDSIRRYVIVDAAEVSVTVLHRAEAGQPWTSTPLAEGDTAGLPEVGTELTVAEMYEDVAVTPDPA